MTLLQPASDSVPSPSRRTRGLATLEASTARERFAAVAPTIAAIFVAGLALRLYCSSGPLWIDEIWSISNVERLRHFWLVLWGISHDNNHLANSLWLYFATGVSENSTWLRMPSIIAGALSIPLMALLGARHSSAAAVAGAALTAFSFFFLNYSIEARGYAMAFLATMIGYYALEEAIASPSGRWRYGLAAATGIGMFCHFATAPTLCLFGLICLIETWRRDRDIRRSIIATAQIFWPSAIALIPAVGCFVAGWIVMGGFTIGGIHDYSAISAIAGEVNLALTTLGAPQNHVFITLFLFGLPPAILIAIVSNLVSAQRRVAYCVILLALPASVFLLHPPNSNIPRYYFDCAIVLTLLCAELVGGLWRAGGWRRLAGAGALAASLAGGLSAAADFQATKTTTWVDALDVIHDSGAPRLGGLYDRNVHEHVDFFNRNHEPKLELVPPEQIFAEPPEWFVVGIDQPDNPVEPRLTMSQAGCVLIYEFTLVYGGPGLSQTPWALYRRKSDAPTGSCGR